MCLHLGEYAKKPKPQTALEDIYCYKVLRLRGWGQLYSPYQETLYELNTLLTATLKHSSYRVGSAGLREYNIHEGLHTLVDIAALQNEMRDWDKPEEDNTEGYFAFVAVIPKGSKYYQGGFNSSHDAYASNQLIVLDRNHPESLKRIANK